jgi:RNA polymerase sigma factor (sigma-70 family)
MSRNERMGPPKGHEMEPAAAAMSERRSIEPELVVRFVAGDQEAFATVFERLQTDVFHLVRRYFFGAFDQEEAQQEVWLKLYRMRDRFDVNRVPEFIPWIRQVARNRCLDLLKERGRSHEVPVADTEQRCEPSQLEQLAERRLQQALAEFSAGLDAEEARVFELCFVEELSHEEVAVAAGISVRRSKYLKKKLLARLTRSTRLRSLGER